MIRKAFLASAGALVGAVALSACVTSSGTKYHVVDPYQFFNGAARGGVQMMVAGNPFPGREAQTQAAIAQGYRTNFSTFGPPQFVPPAEGQFYRVVVLFNSGHPLPQPLCQATSKLSAGAGQGGGGPIDAVAVFCLGPDPLSSAWVSVPNAGGPDSPEFLDAMVTLFREAIPKDPDPSWRPSGGDTQIP